MYIDICICVYIFIGTSLYVGMCKYPGNFLEFDSEYYKIKLVVKAYVPYTREVKYHLVKSIYPSLLLEWRRLSSNEKYE